MKARDLLLAVMSALFLRWLATGHVTAVIGGTRLILPALAVVLAAVAVLAVAAATIAAACRCAADLAVPAWAAGNDGAVMPPRDFPQHGKPVQPARELKEWQ